MKIQEHLSLEEINADVLGTYKAIGVDYVAVMHPPQPRAGEDRRAFWRDRRQVVEAHGLKLNNVGLRPAPEIILGRTGRDESIEGWCCLIRDLGAAGIPTLGYNFRGIGNFRTESTIGRGAARYSTFDYEEFARNPQDHPDRAIDEATLRANLRYFIERIVPVAEEAGVLLTMHPDDPPTHRPLGGAARILSSLDDFERLFELASSPANAMLFCQGCIAEMGEDIPSAIRRIAGLGKIGAVHFRNIRGGPLNFQEVFLDEGDMDMLLAMQTYREVGFAGPFMMDHSPGFASSSAQWAGRAFAVGYIRAMIQAAYR